MTDILGWIAFWLSLAAIAYVDDLRKRVPGAELDRVFGGGLWMVTCRRCDWQGQADRRRAAVLKGRFHQSEAHVNAILWVADLRKRGLRATLDRIHGGRPWLVGCRRCDWQEQTASQRAAVCAGQHHHVMEHEERPPRGMSFSH